MTTCTCTGTDHDTHARLCTCPAGFYRRPSSADTVRVIVTSPGSIKRLDCYSGRSLMAQEWRELRTGRLIRACHAVAEAGV